MSKQLKQYITEDLKRRYESLENYILVDFRGLNSAQSFDLRCRLREAGMSMQVVPNRLAFRILDRWEGKREEFRELFRGPTAIIYNESGDDAGTLAASRIITQWRRKNKNLLAFKGGMLDTEVLRASAAEKLSTIPTRDQLLAQVAGAFQGPLRNLATVLQGTLTKLACALEAYKKKLEEESGKAEG